MTRPRVLVMGASGFVGSWLAARLCDRGERVTAVVRRLPPEHALFHALGLAGRARVVTCALEERHRLATLMAEAAPDVVFHSAGEAIVGRAAANPQSAFATNVVGTANLLDAVRQSAPSAAVVIVSTVDVYEGSDGELREDSPLVSAGTYGLSKVGAEETALTYFGTGGIRGAIARCTNLYGAGDPNLDRIVPGTVASVLRGDAPVIRSNGLARHDFLCIDDAVEGLIAIAERLLDGDAAGEVFNLSSGASVSVIALVRMLLVAFDRIDLEPRVLDQLSTDGPARRVSAAKAARVLGWRAQVPLEIGLARTSAWYAAGLSARRSPGERMR